jgi:hypothetical protein
MAGIVACDRIAKMKGYLKMFFSKHSKCTVQEAFQKLLEIERVDLKGHLESRTISFKHNQVFMNFKFIRTVCSQNAITEFAKERVKWYASKSFKYEVTEEDEKHRVYVVKKKKELGGVTKSSIYGDEAKVMCINGELF